MITDNNENKVVYVAQPTKAVKTIEQPVKSDEDILQELVPEMFKYAVDVQYDPASVKEWITFNNEYNKEIEIQLNVIYAVELTKVQVSQAVRAEERQKFLGAIEYLKEITK